VVELILGSLPNLSSIELPDEFVVRYLQPRLLLSLKHASLSPISGDYKQNDAMTIHSFDLGHFQRLIVAAPNLEILEASRCFACYSALPLYNLLSVSIEDSILGPSCLTNILAHCGNL
jgi:hypothetical protein